MSVVTIKTKARHVREWVEVASRKSNGQLDSCRECVLVVYNGQGAQIYFERDDLPLKGKKSL